MKLRRAEKLRDVFSRGSLVAKALILTFISLLPMFANPAVASAAPTLGSRQLQSTTSKPGVTTDLTWVFDTTADAGNADVIEIEFCDTPLGSCTSSNTPSIAASPTATLSGPWTSTTVSSTTRESGDSGGTDNQISINKTTADDASGKTGLTISLGATDITNNSTPNLTYYTRVRVYSDTGTTLEWEGVFAQSTAQQLTVNARVQERLDFCVGTTSVNDATTSPGSDCTAISGNTVDIGIIDASSVSVSPVPTINGGSNVNGIAMVRTNAVNGAVIDYFAEQDTSSGKLKVAGATCSGTTNTDQCFNSAGTTQTAFSAGTEKFGMTVAGTNCGSTSGYTCVFASGSHNLKADQQYQGDGTFGSSYTFGTTNGFAWDDSGSPDRIASSAGSSLKVIDDEALILKFAATASVTTPTGQYTVTSTYIATATF